MHQFVSMYYSIGQVQAMSFQKLPLKFSMPSSQMFSLDETNGYVTLKSPMTYIKNTRKYEYDIVATETYTNFKTTSKVFNSFDLSFFHITLLATRCF